MKHKLLITSIIICVSSFGLNEMGYGANSFNTDEKKNSYEHSVKKNKNNMVKQKNIIKHYFDNYTVPQRKKKIHSSGEKHKKFYASKTPNSYYFFLAKHIDKKVSFQIMNNFTHEMDDVLLSGEDIFFKLKGKKSNQVTKDKFKKYMRLYYKKNPYIDLDKVIKKCNIDMLDFDNFAHFHSLKKALIYYGEQDGK